MDKKSLLLECLNDVKCSQEMVEEAILLDKNKDNQGLYLLLRKHRCCLMEGLHEKQREVDCLDFLLYSLKKKILEEEK